MTAYNDVIIGIDIASMFVNLVDLQNTFLIKFLQNCVSQKA
jgi:Tfp pilus assembly PilM family ATPase